MNGRGQKRLPKAERRSQLLAVAQVIVREEGTDALTLGRLAECAGVSKPIAYLHFGSRSGLLMALYREIDEHHIALLLDALSRAPRRLDAVARVASDAYMACYTATGPQAHAIAAALQGDEEMEAFHQDLVDNYVALYCDMLAPYAKLSKRSLHLHCIGLLGAAEAISRDMIRGRISEKAAATTFASLIVGTLSPRRQPSRR